MSKETAQHQTDASHHHETARQPFQDLSCRLAFLIGRSAFGS